MLIKPKKAESKENLAHPCCHFYLFKLETNMMVKFEGVSFSSSFSCVLLLPLNGAAKTLMTFASFEGEKTHKMKKEIQPAADHCCLVTESFPFQKCRIFLI